MLSGGFLEATMMAEYLVEKGLAPGERIVAEGIIKVRPGMTVRVRGESAPQAASQAAPSRRSTRPARARCPAET